MLAARVVLLDPLVGGLGIFHVLAGELYDAAVGYMSQAGVREPPECTPRRAQYDLCVNYLVLDSWDRRDISFVGTSTAENPSFRRLLNQLKLTKPDVSNLDTSGSGGG